MNYAEFWKTVHPHIEQIQLATLKYVNSVKKDLENGTKDKDAVTNELSAFTEVFLDRMEGIAETASKIAHRFHIAKIHTDQMDASLKGGSQDASLSPETEKR